MRFRIQSQQARGLVPPTGRPRLCGSQALTAPVSLPIGQPPSSSHSFFFFSIPSTPLRRSQPARDPSTEAALSRAPRRHEEVDGVLSSHGRDTDNLGVKVGGHGTPFHPSTAVLTLGQRRVF